MLLIWTCEGDATADWFISTYLNNSSLKWCRFNSETFPERTRIILKSDSSELLIGSGTRITAKEIRSVWYRRPGESSFLNHSVSETSLTLIRAESARALEYMRTGMCNALWVNDPEANRNASHKLNQLHDAERHGLRTPDTLITNEPEEVKAFAIAHGGHVIAKPLQRGTVIEDGTYKAFYTTLLGVTDIERLAESIAVCPLMFQEQIEKAYELRITVIGNQCFAVKLESQTQERTLIDWRKDPTQCRHSIYELPESLAQILTRMTKESGLYFTAFDLIAAPSGEYIFLEHNPNGQFAWLEEITGVKIGRALLDLFQHA